MPPHLDEDIAMSTENKVPSMSSFMPPEADSHVLLAACGAGEAAWEMQGRGWFTTNLLRVLESVRFLSHLTYYELMERIPFTAKCVSLHVDLFVYFKDVPLIFSISSKPTSTVRRTLVEQIHIFRSIP